MGQLGGNEKLVEAHAAIQQWIAAQGLRAAGAPWEIYTTYPADYPDPQDWKTDVFWAQKRRLFSRSALGITGMHESTSTRASVQSDLSLFDWNARLIRCRLPPVNDRTH
jgi:hypothetical protein